MRCRQIDRAPARMETHGNAARFHVASKDNRAAGTLQGLCASRLDSPVRMNGIERGAQPLYMVTATDDSPARRGGAATYGAARGRYFPTLTADLNATAVKTAATAGRVSVQQQLYGPTLNASWLLFDFGTRSGSVAGAREALLAADWTHNAVIQDVVLQVETAYFQYHATKALLAAQQTTLKEAQTNLQAAEQRHRVGLATIADVLQARTARSQVQLALETAEGTLQTARGALALSMGLPANVAYDVALPPDTTPPLGITDSLDVLIDRAVRERPDLMAARAAAQASQAHVAVARWQALASP